MMGRGKLGVEEQKCCRMVETTRKTNSLGGEYATIAAGLKHVDRPAKLLKAASTDSLISG
jgi:hypothetical protein